MSAIAQLVLAAIVAALLVTACSRADRAATFELRDDLNQPWSLEQQNRGIILVFGYTHCLDTCPLTLAKLLKALSQTGPSAEHALVAFVTVDPQRDTPSVLHAYLSRFGRQFVGLTGTQSEIDSVEQRYNVWAQRLPAKNGAYDYDDAHSSTIFFIDRRHTIVSLRDPDDSIGDLVHAIRRL